jgi:2,4-dienoyl-CoA reductase (NADPH2)
VVRVDYDVSTTFKWPHAAWVKEFGVNVLNLTEAVEVMEKGLLVKDGKGKQRLIEAGTMILAGPGKSVQDPASSLAYVCDELFVTGDAIQPRLNISPQERSSELTALAIPYYIWNKFT